MLNAAAVKRLAVPSLSEYESGSSNCPLRASRSRLPTRPIAAAIVVLHLQRNSARRLTPMYRYRIRPVGYKRSTPTSVGGRGA